MTALCRELAQQIGSGILTPLVAYTQTLDDETALRIRCDDVGDSKESAVTKILQTEATLGLLVRREGVPEFIVIRIPTYLQHLDHNTAETLLAAVSQTWDIPAITAILALFPRTVAMMTNDRAASNLRRELIFMRDKLDSEHRLRTTCDVHKAHTAQGHQFDLVKPLVSGVIGLGVSMMSGGSTSALRDVLRLYFTARLRIIGDRCPFMGPPGASCELNTCQGQTSLPALPSPSAQTQPSTARPQPQPQPYTQSQPQPHCGCGYGCGCDCGCSRAGLGWAQLAGMGMVV